MRRGRHQILYNFLPGEVVDYSDEDNIARVKQWRTQPVQGVNRPVLTELVSRRIRWFPQGSKGYPKVLAASNFELLTPRHVEVELFPLSFECTNAACGRVTRFRECE